MARGRSPRVAPGGAAEPRDLDALRYRLDSLRRADAGGGGASRRRPLGSRSPARLRRRRLVVSLPLSSPDPGAPSRLRFEGLATVADVWLNGAHILRSESMFVAHTVDVASILRADNELVLCFHALSPLLTGPTSPAEVAHAVSSRNQGLRWHRTSLLGPHARLVSACGAGGAVAPDPDRGGRAAADRSDRRSRRARWRRWGRARVASRDLSRPGEVRGIGRGRQPGHASGCVRRVAGRRSS